MACNDLLIQFFIKLLFYKVWLGFFLGLLDGFLIARIVWKRRIWRQIRV